MKKDLTCAIADLGLCVKHDADTDAVDFPPEMGAVEEEGSAKVKFINFMSCLTFDFMMIIND